MAKKHVHYDLIEKWASDTSKDIVELGEGGKVWDSNIDAVIDDTEGKLMFKIKPREFIKGHWYPVLDVAGESCVYMHMGYGNFSITGEDINTYSGSDMEWIGESLGEIEFGG